MAGTLRDRLTELARRIDAKVDELETQGVLHGREREKAVDLRLRHLKLAQSMPAHGEETPASQLATDVESLRLSFERWIARIDEESEK